MRSNAHSYRNSFRPSSLEGGLSFGYTILGGFNAIAAHKCAPRTNSVRFKDHVCVYEHGAMVSRHRTSQIDRIHDAVGREQVPQVFDRQIEQARYTPDRNKASFDGETEDLDERS